MQAHNRPVTIKNTKMANKSKGYPNMQREGKI